MGRGTSADYGYGIASDSAGAVYLVGTAASKIVNFNATYSLSSTMTVGAGVQSFIVKLNGGHCRPVVYLP
jgi:hypothetical protein